MAQKKPLLCEEEEKGNRGLKQILYILIRTRLCGCSVGWGC